MNANDRSIIALVTTGHGLVHTYELSIPIFMTVWLAELGIAEATLGAVVGAGYFLFGAGALPSGILVDRFGSRRLIAGGLAGMGAAFVLLGLLPGLWGLGAALLAWGAAASVYHPAGLALISTGVRQRGRALAYHGIAGNVGIAGGPLVTALLLLAFDWATVAVLLGLPALVAAAAAWRASVDESAAVGAHGATGDGTSAAPAESARRTALWRQTRQLFASGFAGVFVLVALSGLYYRGMLTFLPDLLTPLVAVDLPIDVSAGRYVYAGLLTVGIAGQYVGGRLSDRAGTEWILAGALGLLAAVAAVFLPVAGWGTGALLIASAGLGFLLFLVQPLYQATVAEYTPPDTRGLSYGYTYLAVFGIGAAGAALSGGLLQITGPSLLFGVLAGIALLGAGLSAGLAVRRGQGAGPEEGEDRSP
ncbi:MFS transporter [Salinibacter grassmerensis]|uniref:MFS transporter n=1 Tax=Salinibacter grassmerensis TaxID=3040353 RepID=UPI0021E75CAB|nr:MFS transporter [Salinibacter grassmerensis]